MKQNKKKKDLVVYRHCSSGGDYDLHLLPRQTKSFCWIKERRTGSC